MKPYTHFSFWKVRSLFSALLILACMSVHAQTTLYSENFSGYSNGTSTGTGNPAKWTRDISGTSPTYFDVQSSVFRCADLDGEAEWYSAVIPIYGWSSVSASVYLPTVVNMENSGTVDYIRVYYKLNGGSETLFSTNGSNTGSYTSKTASVSGLSGNTLQIVIRVYNNSTDENHYFDNISVTGTNSAIYSEPFSYSNGTTTSSKWSISSYGASPTVFSVQSGQFRAVDADADVVWTSSSINISNCVGVSVSVDISESGYLESDDYIKVLYKLNGGAETLFPTNGSKYDDFSSATASVSGLTGSTLQIVVRANNDATDEYYMWDDVTVTGSCGSGLSVSSAGTNIPSCSGSNSGAINLTVSGGQTPYAFSWSNAATTEDLSNLAVGTYTVTITDNAGRTATNSRTITKPAALTPTATVTSNFNGAHISCPGATNGAITVDVTGGRTNYTYLWNGGSTSQSRSNLGAGTYTVTVTDADGCTASASKTITAPTALGTSFSTTAPTCPNSTNGAIDLTVTGGTGTKTYLWSTGVTTEDLSNLVPEDYDVTVTDANGCSTTGTKTLIPTHNITSAMTVTPATGAGGTNGAISQTVSGGTAPYTYLWSNGATTKDLSGLSAGTYMVTITDANTCKLFKSATVVEKISLYCEDFSAYSNGTTTSSTWTQSCASCSATGSNGDWEVISNAWRAWDLDNVGTWTSSTIDISGYTNVSASVNVAEVGSMTGSDYVRVYYKVNGGSNTYFTTSGNNSGNFTSATASVSGLKGLTLQIVIQVKNNNAAGIYHTFDNVCVTGELAVELAVSQTNITCNGGSNGAIDLTVNNYSATPPFTYVWSTGATTQDLTGLSAGTYTVTVTDATGIKEAETVTLTQPAALSGSILKTNTTCATSTNGAANLTPSGGTAPRTFLWSNGITSEDLTGLKTGAYTVTITDSKGCTASTSTTISSTSTLNSTTTVTNVTTPGGSNGAISQTVTGASGSPTYLWSHGATTKDLTNLSSGTYTVTVTDGLGCTKTKTATVLDPETVYCQEFSYYNGTSSSSQWSQSCYSCTPVNWDVQSGRWAAYDLDNVGVWTSASINISEYASVRLSVNLYETDQMEYNDYIRVYYKLNGGSETLFATNGNMTDDFTSATAVQTGLSGSTVQIVVRVFNDAEHHYFDNVCVYGYPPFYLDADKTDLICAGGSDGAIDLTVTNGSGTLPFEYLWSNGSTDEDISGLTAGTYTVTVTDNSGISRSTSVTLTQPSSTLAVNNTIVNVTCHGGSDATIILSVSGGSSPYSFLWSNGYSNMNPSGLNAGTYTVSVTDNIGCVVEKTYVVSSPSLPMDITYTGSTDVCTGSTTQVTLHGAQNFTWDPPLGLSDPNSPDPIISLDSTTTYYVTGSTPGAANLVANGDFEAGNIGFSTQYNYTTTNLVPEGRYAIGTNPKTYHSNFNGADHTSGSGKFMIINAATTLNQEVWCQDLIVQPTATYSFSTWIASVHPSNPARLEFSINGTLLGTDITAPGATYTWNEFTANWVSDTTAARFCIVNRNTIAGGNDFALDDITIIPYCVDIDTITIVVNNLPGVEADADGGPNQTICYGDTANLEASGGVTFEWSNGVTTAENFVAPSSNTSYQVTVTDINGCSASDTVEVAVYDQIFPVISDYQDVVCGVNSAFIDLSVSGGLAPYTYLWSHGATTQDITSLAAATYTVTVTDAHSCTASVSQVIAPSPGIALNFTTTDISCHNLNDGSIDLSASGGTPPYTYLWSTGSSSQDLSGLAAGTYTVTVTGANGCSSTGSRTIVNPAALAPTATVTDITCHGLTDGIVDVSVTGGWSPYTYSWNGGAATQDRSGLSAGTYTVTVTDSRSCTATLSRSIIEPAVLGSSFNITNNVCNAGSTGGLDLTVTGGTTPYTYEWSTGAVTEDLVNQTSDEYWVTVTDAHNCIRVDSAIITEPAEALLVGLDVVDVTCTGITNGTVEIDATGGVPPYSYLALIGYLPGPVDSSNAIEIRNVTATMSTLAPRSVKIWVTDSIGCVVAATGEVSTEGPILSLTKTNVNCNGGSTGAINLTADGAAPLDFLWSTGATTEDISNLAAGTYTVTVTDIGGCLGVESVSITQPVFSATVTPTNTSCPASTDGSATVGITGGTSPFDYVWSNGATGQTATNPGVGTYTVTITDAAGCTVSASGTVASQSNINPSVFVINVTTHGGNNGSINQTLSGGVAPYSYLWSTGSTSRDLTNRTAGTYTVTITDANSCTFSYSRTIEEPGACPCTWLGTISGDWTVVENWDCGFVPTDTCDVIIPSAPNPCTINGNSNKCRDLIIEAGINLVFSGNAHLEIYGDVVNNGNITWGNSTVVFKGTQEQNLGGTNVSQFHNLNINNSSSTGVVLGNTIVVNNELKLLDGYLFTGSDTVKVMSTQNGKLDTFSKNSFIVGKLFRKISNTGSGNYQFPVGDAGNPSRFFKASIKTFSLQGTTSLTVWFDSLKRHTDESMSSAFYNPPLNMADYYNYEVPYVSIVNGDTTVSTTFGSATGGINTLLGAAGAMLNTPAAYVSQVFNLEKTIETDGVWYSHMATEGMWHFEPDLQPTGGYYHMTLGIENISGLADNSFGVLKRPSGSSARYWSGGGGKMKPFGGPGRRVADGVAMRMYLTTFSEAGAASSGGTTLPIELLDFKAELTGSEVDITWVTATETNNDYFTLEKSDGSEFRELAIIPAAGNSTTTKYYSKIDNRPFKGTSYYRLKQTDYDGKFSYSDVVSVYYQPSLSGESDNGLVVYPNPSGYNFSVTIKEPAEKVTFTLFDTKGELILTDTLNADVENYTFPVQLQNVPSGVYYIKAEIGDKVHKAKQLILVGN